METKHKPVLLKQVLETLKVKPGGTYADLTLGGGGHSFAIVEAMQGKGVMLVLDQDPAAIAEFKLKLIEKGWQETTVGIYKLKQLQIYIEEGSFRELDTYFNKHKMKNLDGILADLGISTDQLEDEMRGFSFQKSGELDMRMSPGLNVKASDLLNGLYKQELIKLFGIYGDIEFAPQLVNEILKERAKEPINTTKQLRAVIQKVVPYSRRKQVRNPDSRVFQALRIAVNDELNALREMLPQAFAALADKGRLAVISFHSGEDRQVKTYFKELIQAKQAEWVTEMTRPVTAEVVKNPNSSSAKLRVIAKK